MIAGELNPNLDQPSTGAGSGLSIDANVIQDNLANDDGGGLRFLSAGNGEIDVTNNMIVNNISTHEGGGIALDDSTNVHVTGNTIMKNLTTATAVTSNGQPAPAGLSTGSNSDQLQGTLPAGSPTYSQPRDFRDNIFWDNLAGRWDPASGNGARHHPDRWGGRPGEHLGGRLGRDRYHRYPGEQHARHDEAEPAVGDHGPADAGVSRHRDPDLRRQAVRRGRPDHHLAGVPILPGSGDRRQPGGAAGDRGLPPQAGTAAAPANNAGGSATNGSPLSPATVSAAVFNRMIIDIDGQTRAGTGTPRTSLSNFDIGADEN